MLRFIVCLMLCLCLPSQSAWAAWRMAAAPVSQPDAPMPCHAQAQAADSAAEAADAATPSSSTCPHCGTCAACVLAHALPGTAASTWLARPLPQVAPAEPLGARIAAFTTGGPDRPPRAG